MEKETEATMFFPRVHLMKSRATSIQKLAIFCFFHCYSSTSSSTKPNPTCPSQTKYPQQLGLNIQLPFT